MAIQHTTSASPLVQLSFRRCGAPNRLPVLAPRLERPRFVVNEFSDQGRDGVDFRLLPEGLDNELLAGFAMYGRGGTSRSRSLSSSSK
jgi:hypothetical protein